MPRLVDVLADHPALPFIIEVKGDNPAVARAAAAVVARAGALDRVCFGGFSDVTLAAVRAAQPDRVHQRRDRGDPPRALQILRVVAARPRARTRPFRCPESSNNTTIVTKRFIRQAHRAGKVLHVWTVNTPEDIRRLASWGADGVISDRPDMALQERSRALSAAPA